MKKTLSIIICFMATCFTGCNENNNTPQPIPATTNIETEAQKTFTQIYMKWAKYPDDLKLSDFETIFKTDSMVAIKFITRGKNSFGGYTLTENLGIYRIPIDYKDTPLNKEAFQTPWKTQHNIKQNNAEACYTIYDTEELEMAGYDDNSIKNVLHGKHLSKCLDYIKDNNPQNDTLAYKCLLTIGNFREYNGRLNGGTVTTDELLLFTNTFLLPKK